MDMDSSLLASEDVDSLNCTVIQLDGGEDGGGELRRSRVGSGVVEERDEDGVDGLLRLPEMTDTSMESVGQPLSDVVDKLNGILDGEAWEHSEEQKNSESCEQGPHPPAQQPFREDSGGEPPDPAQEDVPCSSMAAGLNVLQASPAATDVCCFTPNSPDSAPTGCGHYDITEHSQSQTLSGGLKDEGEAKAPEGQEPDMKKEDRTVTEEADQKQAEMLSPSERSHPAEFR